jgi:hypothetical protein
MPAKDSKIDAAPPAETPKVYAAINAVQADLAKLGISKDRKNQQQNFSFRGIDDIYNTLASLLSEHKLCILPRVTQREAVERQTSTSKAIFSVTCLVEYDFVSAVDGSRHTCAVYGEGMDMGDKATSKALSAAYKYLCLQAFCIPTEGDNDADATTHDPVEGPQSIVRKWEEKIRNLSTQAAFNAILGEFKTVPAHLKEMIWPNLRTAATNRGLKYVKDKDAFEVV